MDEDVPNPHDTIVEDARNLMIIALQRLKDGLANAGDIAEHVKDVLCKSYGDSVDVADLAFVRAGKEVAGIRAEVSLDGHYQRVSTNDFLSAEDSE